jgi:hypothetical protein
MGFGIFDLGFGIWRKTVTISAVTLRQYRVHIVIARFSVNKPSLTSRAGVLAILVAGGVLCGCRTWPPGDAASDVQAAPAIEIGEKTDPTDKSARKTGRAPIKSTGLDDRSREIERSLGAK